MRAIVAGAGLLLFFALGCSPDSPPPLDVPRGWVRVLHVERDGRRYSFGPFVGYYFKPGPDGNFSSVPFKCWNENGFYSSDAPVNALLFEGTTRLTELQSVDFQIPDGARINPVFFEDAPDAWLQQRPAPQEEYLHFHSCYDATGAVRLGYWLRHEAQRAFTYDMGGKVDRSSPLFHKVEPGFDGDFARIIEFDHGPTR